MRESKSLPSAYPLRGLFDAAVRGYAIRLTCRRCGHVRVLHGHGLWWRFHQRGWPDGFREVRRRAVCDPCRDAARLVIRNPALDLVREAPTGEPLPLPPEHEWRRELRRRR